MQRSPSGPSGPHGMSAVLDASVRQLRYPAHELTASRLNRKCDRRTASVPGIRPTLMLSHAPDIGNDPQKPSLNDTTVSDPASSELEVTAGASVAELVGSVPYRARGGTLLVPLQFCGVFIAGRRSAPRCADHRPTDRDEPAHHSLNALTCRTADSAR